MFAQMEKLSKNLGDLKEKAELEIKLEKQQQKF